MFKVSQTKLQRVLLIEPDVFKDFRGEYIETYNEGEFQKNGIDVKFIQDDFSVSKKNVLRGIHGDPDTWKLVSCPYGKFFLAVVNNDKNSDQYYQYETFTLSDENRKMVLIPPNFGNGHLVLSDLALFHYKQSTYYNPKKQFTIKWNDPKLNIDWPIKNPILSKRDEVGDFV